MNQKEKEVLRIEESFKDTLENDFKKNSMQNKIIKLKDIKYIGEVTWQDKIDRKLISEKVLVVDIQIIEIDADGKERITEQESCYLGDECIGGNIGDNQMIFKSTFVNFEADKMKVINDLFDRVSEKEIENYSMNNLHKKELVEVLTVHFGRKVSEDEVEKLLEEMDESEIKNLKKEKDEQKDKDEDDLSKKQVEKVKVSGIQKADLNKLVDGKETLGKRLDLQQYDSLYVIYSDKVDEITSGVKRNNTTYSLVGMAKDGEAKVLNDEFEMDSTVGNNGSRVSTKIRANSTATRDNNDVSVYTRKSNGMSIGCENNQGNVDMFSYQKTLEENENVGIQIETSRTPIIPMETREIMNRNKGIYQKERVQDEIERHTENGCEPDNVKDFDGNPDTATHEHFDYTEIDVNDYIPNTNMTWREFANKCGYKGEGDIERAVEVVNEMPEVNQETLNEYIEDLEEDYGEIGNKSRR